MAVALRQSNTAIDSIFSLANFCESVIVFSLEERNACNLFLSPQAADPRFLTALTRKRVSWEKVTIFTIGAVACGDSEDSLPDIVAAAFTDAGITATIQTFDVQDEQAPHLKLVQDGLADLVIIGAGEAAYLASSYDRPDEDGVLSVLELGSDAADILVQNSSYSAENVPKWGATPSTDIILECATVVALAVGEDSACAVRRYMTPATVLRKHPNFFSFVDKDAGSLLDLEKGTDGAMGEEEADNTLSIPGFIDLQVAGFGGVDFSSLSLTDATAAAAISRVLELGTAALLPTVISSKYKVYKHVLPILGRVCERPEFNGRVLGIHLEGPFINDAPGARGCHRRDSVREPDSHLLSRLQELAGGHIKLMTMAAESWGAVALCRAAVSSGIVVCLGHQLASEEDIAACVEAGARGLTALGGELPDVVHRYRNAMVAGAGCDDLLAGLITDGHHLNVSAQRTLLRAKGHAGAFVMSSSCAVAGLAPGTYRLRKCPVSLEEDGALRQWGREALAGSSQVMLQCMNRVAADEGLSVSAIQMLGYHNPLRLLGLGDEMIRKAVPASQRIRIGEDGQIESPLGDPTDTARNTVANIAVQAGVLQQLLLVRLAQEEEDAQEGGFESDDYTSGEEDEESKGAADNDEETKGDANDEKGPAEAEEDEIHLQGSFGSHVASANAEAEEAAAAAEAAEKAAQDAAESAEAAAVAEAEAAAAAAASAAAASAAAETTADDGESKTDPPALDAAAEEEAKDVEVTVDAATNRINIDHSIDFKRNKAVLLPVSVALLDKVAVLLNGEQTQGVRVRIDGHTSQLGRGKPARELKLSTQRAQAVKDCLVERGVDAARLDCQGYGATVPAQDGNNMRVEFVVVE